MTKEVRVGHAALGGNARQRVGARLAAALVQAYHVGLLGRQRLDDGFEVVPALDVITYDAQRRAP